MMIEKFDGMKLYSNSKYVLSQYKRQILNLGTEVFDFDPGEGYFKGHPRPFVLQDGIHNLYSPIRQSVLQYFEDNKIGWWGGNKPSAHTLSSQIACLNYLYSIRSDKAAVLALLNGVRDEFVDVLPIECDVVPTYISFEVVSDHDYLNENTSTRGTQCTSIDALIYAVHRGDNKKWLIPIEWKYTEWYTNTDKSCEDRDNEPKGSRGKGDERLRRYSSLIDVSEQLKSMDTYRSSVYFYEPFYQLMRQTLWAENMIKNRDGETLKADEYLHVHVIPKANKNLLDKKYKVSGKKMEETWMSMLVDQSRYVIVDPQDLMKPIMDLCPALTDYLRLRYW